MELLTNPVSLPTRLGQRLKSILLNVGYCEWSEENLQVSSKVRIRLKLFLVSFLILFFELGCIRWVPAHVRYLSYFMNFVLLAVFLGMGAGILAGQRPRLWLPPFPLMWFLLTLLVALNNFELKIPSTQVLYYGSSEGAIKIEQFIVLPLLFTVVAITIMPLGRSLGRLLTSLPPLQAYLFDILGSLTGIAAFFVMSYFSLSPLVWFGLAAVIYLFLRPPKEIAIHAPLLLGILYVVNLLSLNSQWSPYYKIQTYPNQYGGYVINVNNTGHQETMPFENKENFYFRVYDLFPKGQFGQVLILGAGTGSDASIALAEGAQSVDAVEIDPLIYRLGLTLNPDHPYEDPRVNVVIDDGRSFLEKTSQRYDLIVYALPDSLTLTSSFANLRLESYLLTVEALQAARDHLAQDGVLVLYNYYREEWLIHKLAGMMEAVFGEPPHVTTYGAWGKAAVLIGASDLNRINPNLDRPYESMTDTGGEVVSRGYQLPLLGTGRLSMGSPLAHAVDDWPFIYLPQRRLPAIFIYACVIVLLISTALLFLLQRGKKTLRMDWHFFFLGVAFMLLETRSIVTFALLFGSTWVVNSLVFFAVLSSVFLAIVLNMRYRVNRPWLLYTALVVAILVNYLVPLRQFLSIENLPVRYILVSLMAFIPIFLANVVFSHSFKSSEAADNAFASNLIGAMMGGLLEYLALQTGYAALLLIALVAYLLAFAALRNAKSLRLSLGL
jgi:spermidine synthase